MGGCASLGRCVLILLNIVFVIVSLGLVAVGAILKWFPGTLMKFLFDGIKGTLPFKLPAGADNLDVVPFVGDLGLVLLIFGGVLFAVSFLACCGACCKWRVFLVVFVTSIILLTAGLATVGGLFLAANSPLHTFLTSQLKAKVETDYKDPNSGDLFTQAINILSFSLECCAITGPDDFAADASWKSYEYNGNTYQIDTSPACCNKTYVQSSPPDFTCAKKPYEAIKLNQQGCYDKLYLLVSSNMTYAIIGLVALCLLLVLEVVFAIVLIKDIGGDDNKVRPI